jgi:hypothetical protein
MKSLLQILFAIIIALLVPYNIILLALVIVAIYLITKELEK